MDMLMSFGTLLEDLKQYKKLEEEFEYNNDDNINIPVLMEMRKQTQLLREMKEMLGVLRDNSYQRALKK